MSTTKIPLAHIEEGRVLRQLVHWFKISSRNLPPRFDELRLLSRRAARKAGIGPKDVSRLIALVRAHRAKN